MNHSITTFCLSLVLATALLSCAGSSLQAPAFYVSPRAAQGEGPNSQLLREDTAALPAAKKAALLPAEQEVPPQQAVSLPTPSLQQPEEPPAPPQPEAKVLPPVPVTKPGREIRDSLAAEGPKKSRSVQQPTSTLPSLREGLAGQQQAGLEQPAVGEVPAIPSRQQLRSPRQVEGRESAEERREQEVLQIQVPVRQDDGTQVQLLEEQNRLLRQQLQNLQTQQSYFQQQNERLLTLALAARQQPASRVVMQADTSRLAPAAGLEEDTSSYSRMETQVQALQQQLNQLQKQLVADTASVQPAVAQPAEPDTALLKEVEQLRQQVARLQQASSDSSAQLAPLDVYFALGAAEISAEAQQKLEQWVKALQEKQEAYTLVLNGFTDKSGSAAVNLRLANKRIQAVKSALVALGVPQGRITNGYMGIDLQQANLALARRVQLQVKP